MKYRDFYMRSHDCMKQKKAPVKTSLHCRCINNESANDVALTWLLTLKVVHVRFLVRDSQNTVRRNTESERNIEKDNYRGA